ncbi:MAG: hypothetical protein HKN47_20160 [Pirellulaceae bacterium]|nr:hypothetical protein [Pirellulaceae bacterium]
MSSAASDSHIAVSWHHRFDVRTEFALESVATFIRDSELTDWLNGVDDLPQ